MINKKIISEIANKIEQHHKLLSEIELWEDIFDQTINGWDSNFGTNILIDVVSKDKTRYQNNCGVTIMWNGHRTTSKKLFKKKLTLYLNHIMINMSCWVGIKDWKQGIKRYYLLEFDGLD